MSYVKSKRHPNWIYDTGEDSYISPSGRLAPYPGAPFRGTLSEKHYALVKERVEDSIIEKRSSFRSGDTVGGDLVSSKDLTVEVVKTVTIGEVTVNFIRVY